MPYSVKKFLTLFCLLFFGFTSIQLKAQHPVEVVEYSTWFNTVTEALNFLETKIIVSDVTIQLNSLEYANEPSYLSTQDIQMNGFHLTLEGNYPGQKSRIVMDGTTAHVFDNHLSNFTLRNISLEGADPANIGGSIFRQKGSEENINLDYVNLIGGYCGIRATTKINGLHLTNISSSRVPHGTFRLGNGSFDGSRKDTMVWERDSIDYDMWNVEIRNIVLLDDLNNDTIPGSTEQYNGFLLLKKIYNLTVDSVVAPNGNGGGLLSIENSRNVSISNVNVSAYGYNKSTSSGFYIFKCDSIDIFNNVIQTRYGDTESHVSYHLIISDQISFCHNTGVSSRFNDRILFGFQLSHINNFEGNLLKMRDYACIIGFRTFDGYAATMSNDWRVVQENAWSNSADYLPVYNLDNLDGRTYIITHSGKATKVNQVEFDTYQTMYQKGIGSVTGYPTSEITFKPNTFYLEDGSLGRNIVTQSRIGLDIMENQRNNPSDAGAYDANSFSNIGIIEKVEKVEFSLFPNPNNGKFSAELYSSFNSLKIQIFDASGREIPYNSIQKTSPGGSTLVEVDLGLNSKKGLYLIQFTTNKGVFKQSFILN